ncbi:MAG: M28 family peptidase [Clostridiales bacterium]|nr:M28 family peptidase [Clostridiales bacterium]
MTKKILKTAAVFMASCFILMPLGGCSDDEEQEKSDIPADYGTYGADFAREFAQACPYRKAFSEGEAQAGQMIKEEFEELGYEVETQTFSNVYGSSSANYIIRIEGDGFLAADENGDYSDLRKTVVIGAHYDDAYSSSEVPSEYSYDGISDNASGIATLMTIASEIRNYENIGFDVVIVAFGAGSWDYMGATHFYNTLSASDKESIEVMYCIDSIYSGDKVYASAGFNSLDLSQKYAMRRKLYQAYDVAYDNTLASTNNFSLLYNESNIVADVDGDGTDDVYREVTLHKSDYVPFDEAGIPIVFFDSGDYFFDSLDDMKETKNLNLQEFGGMIRDTYLDSSEVLDEVLMTEDGTDILQTRINNVSFVILESLLKGSDYGITHEAYDALMADIQAGLVDESEAAATAAVEG